MLPQVCLWLHESERIYGDRLVSVADLKRYKSISFDMAKKMFGKFNFTKYFQDKNPEILVFAPFSKGHQEEACYDRIAQLPQPGRTACNRRRDIGWDDILREQDSM